MTESRFDEMKRYVRWTAADEDAMRAIGGVASPSFRRIVEDFYERTREHEDAHAVFRDEAQIERLKVTLVRWLEHICTGPYDDAYYEQHGRIGQVHVRIGLPQRYMFTAMALVRTELIRVADTLADPAAARSAVSRLLDLELAIMLETYHDDYVARLRNLERAERAALERALVRSEQRYVNAVELGGVIVMGLDDAGRIVLFNREAERVTGFARDEVVGRSFVSSLLAPDAREDGEARIATVLAGPPATESACECELLTRTGRTRTVAFELNRAEGDDVVVFIVGRDVTDERAMQLRVMQAEKLAAIGTLAAGLAHEIRNPLNGALLHVTFLDRALAKQGAGKDALDAVKLVGDEIRRLSALVKDFLVFARPSTPTLAPVALGSIVDRVIGIVGADALAVKAALRSDPGGSDPIVDVDAPKIEQALLNLVRNAIDAVAASEGHVTVRVRRQPRSAVLEVEDDGPGLPSPDAPIFDAFYSTKPHGTGLGLAIVHRVITDHRGTIDVESRPGRTVFRIVLPLAASEVP